MGQLIITLGRQFGSGGHEIAEKLAQKLGIKMYDRNILDEIANEKNIANHEYDKFDEKPKMKLFTRRVRGHSNSMEEHIANMQFDFIKKRAEEGESFVLVGRCGEHVLKDVDGVISIFVLGDKLIKAKRVMQKYCLDEVEAELKMARHDKNRKHYHNYHSDSKWGHSTTYDICINSSRLGIDQTAEVLYDYIQKRIEKQNNQ